VIDSGSCETGEEPARCQREKNKGEGGGGDVALKMTSTGETEDEVRI
jgi:hypothetical protein